MNWTFNGRKTISDYNLIEGIDNVEETPYDEETGYYYGSPSWNIFNINTNYKVNRNLHFYLNIDNILDIHYKEFASAISAPGRNLSISALINI